MLATVSVPASVVTRFAPSPSGALHLGHAYAALFAEQQARRGGVSPAAVRAACGLAP